METFFAPISAAADRFQASVEAELELDPLTYMVEREAVQAVAGAEEIKTILDPDTVTLRAIAIEAFDRLVWVGDSLEVLAQEKTKARTETSLPEAITDVLRGIFGDNVQVHEFTSEGADTVAQAYDGERENDAPVDDAPAEDSGEVTNEQ